MIFLGMPYRADSDDLVEARVEAGRKVVAQFLSEDKAVQCPVVAFHETMKQESDVEPDFEAWKQMIEEMIVHSTKMIILKLPGFAVSEGVKGEIELAEKHGRQVEYVDPSSFDFFDLNVHYSHSLSEIRQAAADCKGYWLPNDWAEVGNKHVEGDCSCFT